jgi:hypothetical protein
MRTKLVKNIMAPLAVACAFVTSTAFGQGPEGGRIQGTWETQITVNDCAGHVITSFPGMITFQQGGTVMDGTATPPALRTPAEGVWRHTTDNNYAVRMKAFIFTGWSIISGTATVDSTGDAFAVHDGTVQVYDPNGVLLTTLCAESVGTRFEL